MVVLVKPPSVDRKADYRLLNKTPHLPTIEGVPFHYTIIYNVSLYCSFHNIYTESPRARLALGNTGCGDRTRQ